MNRIKLILSATIALLLIFSACNTRKRKKVVFIDKFPEHYRDLTKALPDTFEIINNSGDTSKYTVTYNKNTGINCIINHLKNDTLFEGFAAKYNGIYFLSRMLNDSSYHIHCMHTDGYTIQGLETEPVQIRLIENGLKKELKSLIYNENNNEIRLLPRKEILFQFLKPTLDKFRGDTILNYHMRVQKLEQI